MADDISKLKIFSKRKNATTEHSYEPNFFERMKEELTMGPDDLQSLDREREIRRQRLKKTQSQS